MTQTTAEFVILKVAGDAAPGNGSHHPAIIWHDCTRGYGW